MSGKAKALDDHFTTVELSMTLSPSMEDFRTELPGKLFGLEPVAGASSSGGAIQILHTEFFMRMMAFDTDVVSSSLFAKLPIRSLTYSRIPTLLSNEGRLNSQGSEMGGYEGGFNLSFFKSIGGEISFADRSSKKLRLFAPAQWITARAFFENREQIGAGLSVGIQLGFRVSEPRNIPSSLVSYGRQSGIDARIYSDAKWSSDAHFRFGAEGNFRRANSFQVIDNELGGGGMASVSPFISYELLRDFWVTARMDMPLLRPVGREDIFGDTAIPGLLGKQGSVVLSASAF